MRLTEETIKQIILENIEEEVIDESQGFLFEGDDTILEMFEDATLEEGDLACGACLFEILQEASCGCPDLQQEAEYRG